MYIIYTQHSFIDYVLWKHGRNQFRWTSMLHKCNKMYMCIFFTICSYIVLIKFGEYATRNLVKSSKSCFPSLNRNAQMYQFTCLFILLFLVRLVQRVILWVYAPHIYKSWCFSVLKRIHVLLYYYSVVRFPPEINRK